MRKFFNWTCSENVNTSSWPRHCFPGPYGQVFQNHTYMKSHINGPWKRRIDMGRRNDKLNVQILLDNISFMIFEGRHLIEPHIVTVFCHAYTPDGNNEAYYDPTCSKLCFKIERSWCEIDTLGVRDTMIVVYRLIDGYCRLPMLDSLLVRMKWLMFDMFLIWFELNISCCKVWHSW